MGNLPVAQKLYMAQNLRNYSFSKETANISRRYHDFLCILIMSLICKRFETEEAPYTAETLSDEHKSDKAHQEKSCMNYRTCMIYETSMDGDDESIGGFAVSRYQPDERGYAAEQTGHSRNESLQIDKKRYSSSWEALANAAKNIIKAPARYC